MSNVKNIKQYIKQGFLEIRLRQKYKDAEHVAFYNYRKNLSLSPDNFEQNWEGTWQGYGAKNSFLYQIEYILFEEVLKTLKHPKRYRLIDVGCREGYYLKSAKQIGFRGFGIELYPLYPYIAKMISKKLELDDNFIIADALNLPIKDKSFDVTLCGNTLEHFDKKDAKYLLNEIYRITKRYVILIQPLEKYFAYTIGSKGPRSLFNKMSNSKKIFKGDTSEHLLFESRNSLLKLTNSLFYLQKEIPLAIFFPTGYSNYLYKYLTLKNYLSLRKKIIQKLKCFSSLSIFLFRVK